MESKEFSKIRHYLGKTQKEISTLLCISTKAVQSYEGGWRNIPPSSEKQMLILLSLKNFNRRDIKQCWEVKNCPDEWRENCIVWEYKVRHFCWLINGTFCQGKVQKSWGDKIKICRKCEVYKSMLPDI